MKMIMIFALLLPAMSFASGLQEEGGALKPECVKKIQAVAQSKLLLAVTKQRDIKRYAAAAQTVTEYKVSSLDKYNLQSLDTATPMMMINIEAPVSSRVASFSFMISAEVDDSCEIIKIQDDVSVQANNVYNENY